MVLSIGTGISKADNGSISSNIGTGFIWRAIRTFLHSPAVDSNEGFDEGFSNLAPEVRARVDRLNLEIKGPLPNLDDVHAMEDLSIASYCVPGKACHNLLASRFFFEMDSPPCRNGSQMLCYGSIMCLESEGSPFFEAIEKEIRIARFNTCGSPPSLLFPHDGCTQCGFYRKVVTLRVSSLDEKFQITIGNSKNESPINGFPTSLNSLMDNQGAGAFFGRSDHKAGWIRSKSCYCKNSQERKLPDQLQHQKNGKENGVAKPSLVSIRGLKRMNEAESGPSLKRRKYTSSTLV